jgi:hypothetical protein
MSRFIRICAEPARLSELPKAGENNLSTTALARGRLDGAALTDVGSSSPTRASRTRTTVAASPSIALATLYLTLGERQNGNVRRTSGPRRQVIRSATMAVSRQTTRSRARRVISLKSTRSVIAARRGWP